MLMWSHRHLSPLSPLSPMSHLDPWFPLQGEDRHLVLREVWQVLATMATTYRLLSLNILSIIVVYPPGVLKHAWVKLLYSPIV